VIVHGATDMEIHPPIFGASQRLIGLYRGLARRHEVRVLCVVPNRSPGAPDERVEGVSLRRRKAWYTALAWRLEQARLTPLFLTAYAHRAQAQRLHAQLGGGADVLMADLPLAGLLELGVARLAVYHAHNVEADHFRTAGPPVRGHGFWTRQLEAQEARAAGAADLTIAVSEEDAARLASLYGVPPVRIAVIPNGWDETAIAPADAEARRRARRSLGLGDDETVALFMGSDVPHNRAALDFLLERVMPRAGSAGLRLLVVGGVARMVNGRAPAWLVARPATPDVTLPLHASDIGLNPVLIGGGSNVKLPTYLAGGLAVISTMHGTRGYPDLAPWVTIAEPESFADALAARPRGWQAAGQRMPEPLAAYAWGRLGERLGEVFAAALERRPTGSPALRSSRSGS
jgi:hypothetical protein